MKEDSGKKGRRGEIIRNVGTEEGQEILREMVKKGRRGKRVH